ncbi:MAG: hypothetical protein Q4C56_06815 [Peptococcaceae bacterium]|nr:hypothetical protein [Peptococcaceae bacterium]
MKYELKIESENMDELLLLFQNLKDQPIHTLPQATKVTVEMGDVGTSQNNCEVAAKQLRSSKAPEEKAPTYTLEDVQRAVKEKSVAGGKAHMREILAHYGAAKVSALKPEQYADVMAEIALVEV